MRKISRSVHGECQFHEKARTHNQRCRAQTNPVHIAPHGRVRIVLKKQVVEARRCIEKGPIWIVLPILCGKKVKGGSQVGSIGRIGRGDERRDAADNKQRKRKTSHALAHARGDGMIETGVPSTVGVPHLPFWDTFCFQTDNPNRRHASRSTSRPACAAAPPLHSAHHRCYHRAAP